MWQQSDCRIQNATEDNPTGCLSDLYKGLNDRAENSHQPTRRRERQMKQFKSAGQAQRFLSAHDQINNLFNLRRDHASAAEHRASRTQTFRVWAEICGVAAMI
jgi:putative transposase